MSPGIRPGTTKALESIGVRDYGGLTLTKYGELPVVQSGWKGSSAFFKQEGTGTLAGPQINIGLGHGPALNIFNDNLIKFNIVPK